MTAGYRNPATFEQMPEARLGKTARDVWDILQARQQPGGLVAVKQKDLAERLDITVPSVSRAISELKDRGLVNGRTQHGKILIHPLFAAYESEAHMINHVQDPGTHIWPLTFPGTAVALPRGADPRHGTDFDPDPDGGEEAPMAEAAPFLRLAG
ncbi:helix-turn-helix domain-containing protein [Streptomyces sp. NPDC046685]|uniref:helix-turn-helix domain-containing protein n=1 Tax=Streptomyces sp. NPDC046685 TaxID=3157202 RepID=UPI0033CA8760